MIKAVIFDVGGVLHDNSSKAVRQDIMETLRIDDEAFKKAFGELIPLLGTGKIDEKKFWERLLILTGSREKLPPESLFLRTFKKVYTIKQDVIDLVKHLKEQGYKVAVLSNTITIHAEFNRRQGIYDEFNPVILSNEVRMQKPDVKIYSHTLNVLEVKPEEAVFIDDLKENVDAANKIGIHGLLFTDTDSLKKDLTQLGVTL